MKSRSFNEHETSTHQNSFIPQYIPMRASNIGREISNDHKIKRMSPLPQQRFSNLSSNYLINIPQYQTNEYQLPVRQDYSHDYKKMIQDLTSRIQRLQMRSQKSEKIVERLDINYNKYSIKGDSFESKSQEALQGNQNRMNIENCIKTSEDQLKHLKSNNFITREQLQRQLIGLDSAFKTLIKQLKTNTNLQIRNIHTKQKKAIIQVVASQITDKLQTFKHQIEIKIESAIRDYLNKQPLGKNIMGVNREKFIGTAIPLKLSEELTFGSSKVEKQLSRQQTMYYLDNEGYLLDSSYFYLLDGSNSKIKLAPKHLDVLMKEGLLGKQGLRPYLREGSLSNFNIK